MAECSAQLLLGFHPELPICVAFDAPEISSDGGLLLLRQVDEQLGLTAGLAGCLQDRRDPLRIWHSRTEQVRQRVFQIALGYEDCNDADDLRRDPLFKTVCGRQPDESDALSSQPTLSRFENAVDGASLRRALDWLEESYVASLAPDTTVVILDIDSTDDVTHGQQQLSFFNGFYRQHIYHPLLVYDGDSGELISALLRPGKAHAGRGALGVLRRLVRRLRRRFPGISIVVRADAGFAMPALMTELERLQVDYLIGIGKNGVLRRLLEPTAHWAEELFREHGQTVQQFSAFPYAAKSWPHSRWIVAKAEHAAQGANPRFVVTTLRGFDAETLYRVYVQRGQSENWIKDLKNALQADRLSCSRFQANVWRLLLHAVAYRLMNALRQRLAPLAAQLGRAQFDTIRLRLLKVAAWVSHSTRRILVRLPHAFPQGHIFAGLLSSFVRPAPA